MTWKKNEILKQALQLVMPITILLFALFTKWWNVLPVDAPYTVYRGFPFPYAGRAWHTSGALQIFVLEFIADLLVYFLFVFCFVLFVNSLFKKRKPHKMLTITLWSLSLVVLSIGLLIGANKDNLFYLKRPYEMKIKKTGFEFWWDKNP
jgi:hypothetical protein